jgi:hypothetical protein
VAQKRQMGQWAILACDTLVSLRLQFQRSRKFRRGHVVALVSTEDEARRHGGVYAVRPIDGPDTETPQQLPRSAFTLVTEKKPKRRYKVSK